MRKANAPRKLSPDVSRRLSDSRRQSAALTLREIHCPFCSFLVEKVFSDAAGHKMVYCRKCKSEYPINLGCFRRIKAKQAVCRLFSGKPRQKRETEYRNRLLIEQAERIRFILRRLPSAVQSQTEPVNGFGLL